MNWTEEDYQAYLARTGKPIPKPKKKNKYNARKVTVDGLKFDSRKEADYYSNLKLLKRAGEIKGFCRQARFYIGAGREYVCDFIVWHESHVEIIDVKGFETDVFKIKKDMFDEMYPGLELKIVKE